MKYLISILFSILSFAALAQPGSATYGVYKSRVNDSTASPHTDGIAAAVAAGYAYIFFNNQASTPHWDVYTDAGVEHIFSFAGGGGGSQDLQSVLDEGSIGSVAGAIAIVSSGDEIGISGATTQVFSTANDIEVNSADDIALTVVGTVDITNQVPLLDSVTYLLGRRASDGAIVRKAVSSISGSGTPGGSDTQVQYNDGGSFGGEADMTYNETTNTLTVDNVAVDTEAYDATGWNGDLTVPTKDALRDKIETIDGVVGAQDLFITGPAFWPKATNGSEFGMPFEVGGTATLISLDFDASTDENAQFQVSLPRNWNNGTVTATVYWTATGGSASETVQWEIKAVAFSNDDPLSGAFGTAVAIDDALIATSDVHISPTSSAITIAGTPADGDLIVFNIMRDVSDDNLAADAKLLGVRITLTLDASTSE